MVPCECAKAENVYNYGYIVRQLGHIYIILLTIVYAPSNVQGMDSSRRIKNVNLIIFTTYVYN